MAQAYASNGLSVCNGFITTSGAGMFLLGCKLSLFRKFGISIVASITISFIVAMIFFGAYMHLFGPEESLYTTCHRWAT